MRGLVWSYEARDKPQQAGQSCPGKEISWPFKVNVVRLSISYPGAPGQAKYGGGTGEPNDPYQIATADDPMLLGESPEDYDKHFILTNDIDLDQNLAGRKVFDRAVIAALLLFLALVF